MLSSTLPHPPTPPKTFLTPMREAWEMRVTPAGHAGSCGRPLCRRPLWLTSGRLHWESWQWGNRAT